MSGAKNFQMVPKTVLRLFFNMELVKDFTNSDFGGPTINVNYALQEFCFTHPTQQPCVSFIEMPAFKSELRLGNFPYKKRPLF